VNAADGSWARYGSRGRVEYRAGGTAAAIGERRQVVRRRSTNGIMAPFLTPKKQAICREELSGVHDSRPLGPPWTRLPEKYCHNGGMAFAHEHGQRLARDPKRRSWPLRLKTLPLSANYRMPGTGEGGWPSRESNEETTRDCPIVRRA